MEMDGNGAAICKVMISLVRLCPRFFGTGVTGMIVLGMEDPSTISVHCYRLRLTTSSFTKEYRHTDNCKLTMVPGGLYLLSHLVRHALIR
jgi:hypothetical protein